MDNYSLSVHQCKQLLGGYQADLAEPPLPLASRVSARRSGYSPHIHSASTLRSAQAQGHGHKGLLVQEAGQGLQNCPVLREPRLSALASPGQSQSHTPRRVREKQSKAQRKAPLCQSTGGKV